MHNHSCKNVSQWCHDSKCFEIDLDLDLETSKIFSQPFIVCTCFDDKLSDVLLQSSLKSKHCRHECDLNA